MINYNIRVECLNGYILYAKDNKIIVLSWKTDKTIPISSIKSFSINEPNMLGEGSIEFTLSHSDSLDKLKYYFRKKSLEDITQLQNYLSYHMNKLKHKITDTEELKELKTFFDEDYADDKRFLRNLHIAKSITITICIIAFLSSFIIGEINKIKTKKIEDSYKITLNEFHSLQAGMTYDDAVYIVGSFGEVLSSVTLFGKTTTMIKWEGIGAIGANANATFDNGILISKDQFGLK